MDKLLQVAQLGHPILRKKAQLVSDVSDPKIQELIDSLIATCMDVQGVGIAAPQVYEDYRIFIVASHPNDRYPNAPEMEPTAIINPKITWKSKSIVKDWEGCLSLPGVRGLVPRYKKIKVEYTERTGKRIKRNFEDFVARIFQHEYDHLEGIVFIDRVESTKDVVMEKEWKRIISQKKT